MTQRIAWITGASTGIGAATALRLAREGWLVAVTARTPGKLEILAGQDAKFLKPYPGDVTDPAAMAALVERIERELGPITLALLNAGTYTGEHIEGFTAENFKQHFEINVIGVGNCLEPIAKKFLARRAGHIAVTASIAGYRGLPFSLSYGPTKAALINMTEALAIECRGTGIKVQLICPGFVKTPLTDQNTFDMPMLMDVDAAAEKLVQGLKSDRFEIVFPWLFCTMTKLTRFIPAWLYIRLMHGLKRKKLAKDGGPAA